MKQNQQFRGIGLVLLVIALITFASSLTSQGSLFSQEMTHQEFMVAVENKTIESVDINQNQQPPTGILDILLKSGDRAVVAVSDVKEAEKLLRENSIDYIVENVPQENYLMSVIIPVALSAVADNVAYNGKGGLIGDHEDGGAESGQGCCNISGA